MTRTKMLAVVGVVLLVALAGCGGTDPENVSEPGNGTDGGIGGGTTDGGLGTATDGGIGTTTAAETTEGVAGGNTTAGAGNMTTTGAGVNETTAGAGNTTGAGAGNASVANVTFMNQTSNGTAVVVANVTLPNGGFVGVHNTTEGGEVGSVVATTPYLEAGTYENLTVQFMNTSISNETVLTVMLYEDTNGNQTYDYPAADNPYLVDGEPVTANATVTVSATGGAGMNGTATNGTATAGNATETNSS